LDFDPVNFFFVIEIVKIDLFSKPWNLFVWKFIGWFQSLVTL